MKFALSLPWVSLVDMHILNCICAVLNYMDYGVALYSLYVHVEKQVPQQWYICCFNGFIYACIIIICVLVSPKSGEN